MPTTGNTDPLRIISGHHSNIWIWRVTEGASGTSITIQTPFANNAVSINSVSEGTALTAQPTFALATGIITQTGITAADTIVVRVEDFG